MQALRKNAALGVEILGEGSGEVMRHLVGAANQKLAHVRKQPLPRLANRALIERAGCHSQRKHPKTKGAQGEAIPLMSFGQSAKLGDDVGVGYFEMKIEEG